MAAALALGPDAVVSHRSAAVVWELLRPQRLPVDVTVPQHVRPRPGIRPHRARSVDTVWRDAIPVTPVARTLLDCAVAPDDTLLRRAVRQAEQKRLVNPQSLEREMARSPGHRGARRLAALIADGPTPTKSELEDMLLELIKRHDLPRPPHINTVLHGHEVDLFYPDRRLIVEADSRRHHEILLAQKDDRARDARLEAAGYRVVRIHYDQVATREDQTAERLRRALAPT
jgi:very-short-patch-repair endonuclease